MDDEVARPRLALLLKHFAAIEDTRERWRVAYPLREVLLLVTCATISGCDDFEDIVAWGEHHLDFLRRFAPFDHGIPCARWLRSLLNRLDPELFRRCFESWVAVVWPGRHDLIAIHGKTARRSHDRGKGVKALHTLSAYASSARLVLAQLSVPEKTNEITAIPDLLDDLAEAGQLEGALVTIDAMGCQVEIADKITGHNADYLLAVKGNQPTLAAEIDDYFKTAPTSECRTTQTVEKAHGRIETRRTTVSHNTDWLLAERSYPGRPRFDSIAAIAKVDSRTEHRTLCTFDTRLYIASAPLDAERIAHAVRAHWTIENQVHWVLDTEFKDDLSRYRSGHGAKNMAVVRRFALNLVRQHPKKGSIKTRRKRAGWSTDFLLEILREAPR
jgi:predicted transposase YbfD/YdcC